MTRTLRVLRTCLRVFDWEFVPWLDWSVRGRLKVEYNLVRAFTVELAVILRSGPASGKWVEAHMMLRTFMNIYRTSLYRPWPLLDSWVIIFVSNNIDLASAFLFSGLSKLVNWPLQFWASTLPSVDSVLQRVFYLILVLFGHLVCWQMTSDNLWRGDLNPHRDCTFCNWGISQRNA